MFAETRQDIREVLNNLLDDSLIQHQDIYVREFVPFKNYGIDQFTGAPITKEFRCFFYKERCLAKGFYWVQHVDDLGVVPDPNEIPEEFLNTISKTISKNINFYVVDVAQKEDGSWVIVELNDAQQSGLSCVDPIELYSNLAKALNEEL